MPWSRIAELTCSVSVIGPVGLAGAAAGAALAPAAAGWVAPAVCALVGAADAGAAGLAGSGVDVGGAAWHEASRPASPALKAPITTARRLTRCLFATLTSPLSGSTDHP